MIRLHVTKQVVINDNATCYEKVCSQLYGYLLRECQQMTILQRVMEKSAANGTTMCYETVAKGDTTWYEKVGS